MLDKPELKLDSNDKKNSKSLSNWCKNNLTNPFINASLIEMSNTAIDLIKKVDPKFQDIKPLEVKQDKTYSLSWFTQNIASGVGSLVPYLIAGKALDSSLAATSESLGLSVDSAKLARVSQIAGAGVWGYAAHKQGNESRLANSLSSMAGFAAFDLGNSLSSELPLTKVIASRALTGIGGGLAMNLTSSLVDKKDLNLNSLTQSATIGLAMNTVLPLALTHDTSLDSNVDSSIDAKHLANLRPIADTSLTPNVDHTALARLYESRGTDNNYIAPQYPHPDDFGNLTAADIQNRGFAALDELAKLQGEDFYNAPRPLPNPKVVASEVGKMLSSIPDATDTGPLKIGEFNMEFLDANKARYFSDSYKQIIPKLHLLFGEEVNEGGLKQIASDNGYNYYASLANSRGQGVGFLASPRIEVNKVTSYDNVATIDGIPDERPALRIDFTDKATGDKASAIVVHLKSMRGGVDRTSQVRFDQTNTLANDLEPNFKGIIAGDFNTFLDHTHDTKPLYDSGFKLAFDNDHQSTQQMGGRLDGFFLKGLNSNPENYTVTPFFKDPLITRGLSDHALTIMQLDKLN